MDKKFAISQLKKWLKKDDTVYTILRHCSKSGMTRSISLIISRDGRVFDIAAFVAAAFDLKLDTKNGGVKVRGGGMDMGFHLVNNLSIGLFCPGKYDHDAAYALKHEWI